MRAPYLYDDADVLRNLGNIRDNEMLKQAEGDITRHTLPMVYAHRFAKFNTDTLREIHRIIFGRLFDWAGEFRTIPIIKREEVLGGDSVRYASPESIRRELDEASRTISKLKKSEPKGELLFKIVRIAAMIWQTHPFREGNTRTVVSFIVLLAESLGFDIDYTLFERHAAYVRNALVWASQGIYSKPEYLERIFFDAAGFAPSADSTGVETSAEYTHIEGYYVADYKEQPHEYFEE